MTCDVTVICMISMHIQFAEQTFLKQIYSWGFDIKKRIV